jgi:hypothetical protein
MSVTESTGSACVDRFRSWAMARLPESCEVDDLLAGLDLYQPRDLPEMIENLREAERACRAAANEIHGRFLAERRQRIDRQHLNTESHLRRPSSIEQELRRAAQSEFCARWWRRTEFLEEVRELLEEELQSPETSGGSD